jgi:hypothetical protein
MKLEVKMVATVQIVVLIMMPYSLVDDCQHFGRSVDLSASIFGVGVNKAGM